MNKNLATYLFVAWLVLTSISYQIYIVGKVVLLLIAN
jgi:hypothetical protein